MEMDLLTAIRIFAEMDDSKFTQEERIAYVTICKMIDESITSFMDDNGIVNDEGVWVPNMNDWIGEMSDESEDEEANQTSDENILWLGDE